MANDTLVTPNFRAAFVAIFKPTLQDKDDGTKEEKYSIRAAFPPDTDLSELKRAAEAAARKKWGDKIPKGVRSPFRTNGELDKPIEGIGDDWVIMSFSSKADKFSPSKNLVDSKNRPILDEVEVYSGAWFRAQVAGYGYEVKGNKGVAFGLRNIQKMKDDEAIGFGGMPANRAFEAVEGVDTEKGGGNIFD